MPIEWISYYDEDGNEIVEGKLVRCKDCRFCHAGYCEKADDIIPFGFAHHEWENFYCAWGERREDGETN